jgi:hypothetical protein
VIAVTHACHAMPCRAGAGAGADADAVRRIDHLPRAFGTLAFSALAD